MIYSTYSMRKLNSRIILIENKRRQKHARSCLNTIEKIYQDMKKAELSYNKSIQELSDELG